MERTTIILGSNCLFIVTDNLLEPLLLPVHNEPTQGYKISGNHDHIASLIHVLFTACDTNALCQVNYNGRQFTFDGSKTNYSDFQSY